MPTPSLALRATRSITTTKDATLKSPTKASSPNFLRFIFQPSPSPINCCTQNTTRDYLDNPAHPYHIKTKRKIAAFDQSKLHWSVGAPLDVAKKRTVRSWVKRRVEEAVTAELKIKGWATDGKVLASEQGNEGVGREKLPLKGALKIFMATDQRKWVITATGEEVRENVRGILRDVVRKQQASAQDFSRDWQDRRPTRRKPSETSRTRSDGTGMRHPFRSWKREQT